MLQASRWCCCWEIKFRVIATISFDRYDTYLFISIMWSLLRSGVCGGVRCDDERRRREREREWCVIDVIGSWSAQAGSLAYSVKSVESQKILTSLSL